MTIAPGFTSMDKEARIFPKYSWLELQKEFWNWFEYDANFIRNFLHILTLNKNNSSKQLNA